jgi:putative proteasome-type protease
MTYCLGIKVKDGLVAIADTRITSGKNTSVKKKVHIEQHDHSSFFIMTSGLRSARDKAVVYFQELVEQGAVFNKLFKAVNAFGEQIKRVADEDKKAIEVSGLKFNLNTIIGGQLKDDTEHKLFLIYSEGNWVEIEEDSPFVIIGNSGHGKTMLNRILTSDSTLKQALKAGFLSFDATRVSSNDVDYPIDVVLYKKNSHQMVENRYQREELEEVSALWDKKLHTALDELPEEWMEKTFSKQHSINLEA